MAKPKKPMKGVFQKNGYWYARVDGREVYCGKGEKGNKTAINARKKYEVKQYESREIRAGLKVKKIELKSVKDLSSWYMSLPKIRDQKIYQRKLAANNHILKFFGDAVVNQVEADDMEYYREHRKGEGAAHGTIDLEIRLLRAMYHLAVKRKKMPADAMPGEFELRNEMNPRRVITDDEFKALLKNSEGDFKDVLICGYESAMRSGEIRKLTATQVKLDIQHISGEKVDYIDLGIFDTKTGARRTVPISARLKKVLQRRLKGLNPDDYVFTRCGRKFTTTSISQRMGVICKRADVPYGDKVLNKKGERIGIVFHCIRHTRTSKWVEAGWSDEIIRRATGHKSLEAYRIYIKLDPQVVMRLVGNENTTKLRQKLRNAL